MLPDVSGIEVCRRVRAMHLDRLVRIVIVSARGEEYDRVLGFESGAAVPGVGYRLGTEL
jgi:two-component system phosphate regulon response regulator PhoB